VTDPTTDALREEHAALAGLLDRLEPDQWHAPTRCAGWDVRDVVLHLAQTDEMAVGSVIGRYDAVFAALTGGLDPASSVDEGVARMVARERGAGHGSAVDRWRRASEELDAALETVDPSTRVPWVAGPLSVRTLTTTRLAETWIHAGDVAAAVGATIPPSARLQLIARLAWRTLPYAFAQAGSTLHGPVALHLSAPDGGRWTFEPDEAPVTIIEGPALDLCTVAARRVPASATALRGTGPDADEVLSLIRTYA
jgi:uncharacterized protein (TIGR03084 family)